MDPLSGISIGSALGSAAAGLGTGILGIASQYQANERNAEYNRAALEFQKYQYEDQKRYNSMVEQVRRIRAAGLNPALMMQNGTIGTAGSTVGSPSFLPQQPLDIGSIGQGIASVSGIASSSIADLARAAKDSEEASLFAIDKLYRHGKNFWDIDNKKALSYMQGSQAEVNLQNAQFLSKSLGDRLMQQRWESEMVRARAGIELIAMNYAEGQQKANLTQKLATAYNAVLTGQASVQQASAAVMNAVTNRNNSQAMYGVSPKQRAEFFNKTLRLLDSADEKNLSEAFKNTVFPESTTIGGKLFGIGHSDTESHNTWFEDWKDKYEYYHSKHQN